ncbi:MAG: hypothetical protein J5J06_13590 [Phycisphaerae bacterium]|nr:hypothetical protein [Phycisphaerae bacterium]
MSELGLIIALFLVAVLILIAEIFIPSHGVLSIAGVGFLIAAIVKTFQYGGRDAGTLAIFAVLVFLPIFAYFAIKYWHVTPIGRRISPPNPMLTSADIGVPIEELRALVGLRGRAVTALRPVGTCEFKGKRLPCVSELGVIDAGTAVVATGIRNGNLSVTTTEDTATA